MYALRRRLDDGPQAGLAVLECVLRAFALVYIDVQVVPTENGPAGVPKGKPTSLKPTIRAVETSEAQLEVIWLTQCDRLGGLLDRAREVLWVNLIAGRPWLQFLERPAGVFEDWVVDEVEVKCRCRNSDQARNAAQDQACIEVACASCCFCPLTFRNKFLLQRFIGFGQFSRPFRDALVELLRDSLLFAHGAVLNAHRRQPAFLSLATPVRLQDASSCRPRP